MSIFAGVALADTGFSDIYSAIKTLTSRPRIPFFDPSMPTKLTVPSDTTAVLGCRVHNLGNYTVRYIIVQYLVCILPYSATFSVGLVETQRIGHFVGGQAQVF